MRVDEKTIAITERELARRLNLSPACLRKWRAERRGPIYVRLGKLIRYLERDVAAWLETKAAVVPHA